MLLFLLTFCKAMYIEDIEIDDPEYKSIFKLHQAYRIIETYQFDYFYITVDLKEPDSSFQLIATIGQYNNKTAQQNDWISQLENRNFRYLKLQPHGSPIYLRCLSNSIQNQLYSISINRTNNYNSCPNNCAGFGECIESKCRCQASFIGNDCNQIANEIYLGKINTLILNQELTYFYLKKPEVQSAVTLHFETNDTRKIIIYIMQTEILYNKNGSFPDDIYAKLELNGQQSLERSIQIDWEKLSPLVFVAQASQTQFLFISNSKKIEDSNNITTLISLGVAVPCAVILFLLCFCVWQKQKRRRYPIVQEEIDVIILDQCAICLSSISQLFLYKTQCGHSFHQKCIQQWLEYRPQCPYCRANIRVQGQVQQGPYIRQF